MRLVDQEFCVLADNAAKFWDILDKYDPNGDWDGPIDPENGNIKGVSFINGSGNLYHLDMFQEAAPLIKAGSWIQLDIDGRLVKWIFDGKILHAVYN